MNNRNQPQSQEHTPLKPNESSEKLLTKGQVAELCQVTPRTIDAWMESGLLVYYKLGRTVRFRLADLQTHWDATCRVARRTR